MASDYGLNFGFRRSDESVRVSEGRIKTPSTGALLLLGTAVSADPTNPGYLVPAAANAPCVSGFTGLLLQEEVWDRSIYERDRVDSFVLGIAKPNRLSIITTGAGTKVWFRNTTAQDRADGRHIDAVTMFTTASVAVGRGLAWNGTSFVDVASPTDPTSFGVVTFYDSSKAYVELVLTH